MDTVKSHNPPQFRTPNSIYLGQLRTEMSRVQSLQFQIKYFSP